ncbi:unnamed protein product [Closterium sp. NIES-65]|nr:unnamed protein product [Closterium sp. NIES-65]
MATPSVLAFDVEGRAIDFEVWVDDLQLYLQCDRADGLSLFDLTSGPSLAPAADADPTVCSQWATRDAAARLAVRRHLPTAEHAHFSQYKSAQTLYDAVVARYSSPATATLSRLMLPFLFPDLAAFPTVADLITHLRTSDTRYRTALPAEDHFLSVCPTTVTVDLLEKALLAAEKSIVAVGASRGDPRTPIFEGCSLPPFRPVSPLPLRPTSLVLSRSVRRPPLAGDAALARARGARVRVELAGAVEVAVEAAEGVGVAVGVVAGVEVSVAAVEAEAAEAAAVLAEAAVVAEVEEAVDEERGGGIGPCTYVLRTGDRAGEQCGGAHPTQRCFGRLTDAWRQQFPEASAGEAAALGASASAPSGTGESALSGTTSALASLTFTLDSGPSRSFFRDRTTLTPLSRPVAVSLADPSGGPVLSRFSTVLPCQTAPSGTLSGLYLPSFSTNLVSGADLQDAGVHQFTPASQRVTHCTEASTGRHLATFTRQPGSSLYTLTLAPPPVAESSRVAASGQVFAAASRSGPESAPCSCRLLSHESLLWHHRLGHPSLLRLRGMASRLLVSGLPRSLPPLPHGPGPACVPCVEEHQRAAPHSSQFPPTEAPLQTLHMDVWGPARVRGQGHERYFLLVVDDYLRYTTVFPLRSKGDVTETFTLPDSPQQNGIAERRIGMVMDVARTSMMHAAAPHFLWPFAVRYAVHQINLHPGVSRPETSPTLLCTGKVGDASAFWVWGSRAFFRDLSADKLSPRAAPCVFLEFPPDAPGWQFYHPTSRRILSSQDVMLDESVPYYRLFPYHTPSLPPPPLYLVPGPPPVDPLPPQGPAPLGVSQPGGAEAGGAEPGGTQPGGAEPGGAGPGGATPRGALTGGAGIGGAEPGGAPPGGSPGASSRREPLSPLELREWFARRWSRAAGAGGSSATECAAVAGPGGARTGSTRAAGPAGSTGAGTAEGVGAETTTGGPAGGAPGAAGGSGAAGAS